MHLPGPLGLEWRIFLLERRSEGERHRSQRRARREGKRCVGRWKGGRRSRGREQISTSGLPKRRDGAGSGSSSQQLTRSLHLQKRPAQRSNPLSIQNDDPLPSQRPRIAGKREASVRVRDYHRLDHQILHCTTGISGSSPTLGRSAARSCPTISTTRDLHALRCQSSRVSHRLGSIMQCATSFATPHGARSPLTSAQPTLTPRTLLSFYSQAIINERTPDLNCRIALLVFRIPNLRKGSIKWRRTGRFSSSHNLLRIPVPAVRATFEIRNRNPKSRHGWSTNSRRAFWQLLH
jgi:hypothetical protein